MNNPDFWVDAIRSVFAFIDSVGYLLLTAVYKIFFTVANAQLLEGDVVTEFFSRIQLILGVLMTFKLAITALNIIINPDMFKDKEKGAGKVLMRIVVSLILLTLVIPVNIPKDANGSLNQQIRNNGFLFGFLYQFQNSVLQDNILGKLILGSDVESNEGNYGDLNNLSDIGMTLSTTVAQAFITPTLKDNVTNPKMGSDGRISEEDVACPIVLTDYEYGLPSTSYDDYLKYINDTCDYDGKEVYIFNYTPFAGLVCSLIMTVIIIGFTLDIAVRAIKLAILRLIAPIPIISYISPGQEKNGAFGNWVKTLASTYIDLFLRLAIIYFGAYVILIISEGGITIWQNTPDVFTSLFSTVFIIIGVLVFMKEAPKFFQDMLGIKGDGKLFSGIGTMLGAAALTGGLAGSIATGAKAAWAENKMAGRPTWMGVGGAITSGITSGVGGLFTGAKTLATTDKKVPSSVMAAMQKRNAMRASHSTLPGRIVSGAYDMFTGSSLAEKDQKTLEYSQEAVKQMQNYKKTVEDEAIKKGKFGSISRSNADMVNYFRANGLDQRILDTNFNYSVLSKRIEAAGPNGDFEYNGVTYNARDFDTNVMGELLKNQTHNYVEDVMAAGDNPNDPNYNGRIMTDWKMAEKALADANVDYAGSYLDPNDIGKTIGKASSKAQQMQTDIHHIKHRANHNANKSK